MPFRIGETFAGYRILRFLGSGGMGEVYLVQHPRLPRQDALKVLRPDVSNDTSFQERFIREADLAGGLRHPHIVGIQDRGEHDGQMWITMDYIEGTDAAQLVRERYPAGMPVELATTIVTAVASALDYAHKKGLLHRDVKPANIIVADTDADDPQVFLADFGIARPVDDTSGITTTNMTVGTVAYAAPEQLMGEPMDGRADQYALAATAYQLLTGMQLFPHSNPAVVISRHLSTDPPPLSPHRSDCGVLDDVLQIALAKNPDDRFSSCLAFAQALADESPAREIASANATTRAARRPDRSVLAPGTPTSTELPDASSSRRTRHVLASMAGTILLLGVVLLLWRPWQHPQSDMSAVSPGKTPIPSPASPPSMTAALSPAPTSAAAEPPSTASTVVAPSGTLTTPASNPNGPGCSSQRPKNCGQWTPEQAAFACRAVLAGADYSGALKRLLMNRYGLSEDSAFFLGKEATYSLDSGGDYIPPPSNAEGFHPMCNDIVP